MYELQALDFQLTAMSFLLRGPFRQYKLRYKRWNEPQIHF